MGFTWTKGTETTAEAQKRIGSMINNTKIMCYYECGLFNLKKIGLVFCKSSNNHNLT